jgi:small ligand-binding sensory domain FIST
VDVERCLQGLDYAYPHSVKIGGLASGGEGTGQTGLFMNGHRYRSGIVGVGISGGIEIDTIVAQGCKPIGSPFSITRCDRNLLIEIDHKKPIEVLQSLYQSLSEKDQSRIQHSLFVGIAATPFHENPSRGDFLIRNLMGLDSKTGALAVGAMPHEGQTGQFYLRDKETSAEDLKWYLTEYQLEKTPKRVAGALMFSCMGRGVHLYGEPDFDSRLFHSVMGDLPMSGFFCNGEIGAVGPSTFLHGYTSCFGLFRPL